MVSHQYQNYNHKLNYIGIMLLPVLIVHIFSHNLYKNFFLYISKK